MVLPSMSRAFGLGFLTNGLNIKATLFFISLFTVVVSVDTPLNVKVMYGMYMAVMTALWFCLLSMVLTTHQIRQGLLSKKWIIDGLMAVILLIFAVKLLVSDG